MEGADELERRVAQLDSELGDSGPLAVVAAFTRVMSMVTGDACESDLSSELADSIVARSRLLEALRARIPAVSDGPLSTDAQFWIATSKPQHLPARDPVPAADRFADARTTLVPPRTKPFGLGLFTSTAVAGTPGMWWAYLQDNGEATGGPFLYPWHVWALKPARQVAVYEVTSAERWIRLAATYPVRHEDLVYPDWTSIAVAYDAVHMTARAVVATQGLRLRSPVGVVAAPFWDVESTLWLRWCFRPPRLVRICNPQPPRSTGAPVLDTSI